MQFLSLFFSTVIHDGFESGIYFMGLFSYLLLVFSFLSLHSMIRLICHYLRSKFFKRPTLNSLWKYKYIVLRLSNLLSCCFFFVFFLFIVSTFCSEKSVQLICSVRPQRWDRLAFVKNGTAKKMEVERFAHERTTMTWWNTILST